MANEIFTWLPGDIAHPPLTNIQDQATVAAIGDGRYVVIWEDWNPTYSTDPGINLTGRIFDAEGNPFGDPFAVNRNDAVGFNEHRPFVVTRPGGGFIVAYEEENGSGQPSGIVREVFDKFGNNLAGGTLTTSATDMLSRPSIAMRSDGAYLLTYLRQGSDDGWDVVGKRVAKNGVVSDEFTIYDGLDEGTVSDLPSAEAAVLSNGNYAVAYEQYNDGSFESDPEVRIYKTNGKLVTTILPSESFSDESDVQIAALKGGSIVVAWTADSDGDGSGIRYSVYKNDGTAVKTAPGLSGGVAAGTTEGSQDQADVVALKDGSFVILWRIDGNDLVGQHFDAKGKMIGGQFDLGDDNGFEGSAALLSDGRFVVASHDAIGGPNDSDIFQGIFDPRGTTINGTAGKDYLTARPDGANVNGLAGNDFLYGHDGNNKLSGGDGKDYLFGDEGKDTLVGGTGADWFGFRSLFDSFEGSRDTIQGFNSAEKDKIALYDLLDEVIGGDLVFIGKQSFADYNTANPDQYGMVRFADGLLQINVDNFDLGADLEIKVVGSVVKAGDLILLAP